MSQLSVIDCIFNPIWPKFVIGCYCSNDQNYLKCSKQRYIYFKKLPGMQTHLNVPGSSRHDPSFLHGCDSHSFTFVSHLGPVNPCVQLQAKLPGVFTHMPSCSHGEPVIKNTIRKNVILE